jgi:hypothetical protein
MKKSELRNIIKEEMLKALNEDSASKLYKIEGLLVSNTDIKWQKEILSDVRAVTGITTVDAKEYTPRVPKKGYTYDVLIVKVDPHPFLKDGGKFDMETINKVIQDINDIRGVVKFKVATPQILNVGV